MRLSFCGAKAREGAVWTSGNDRRPKSGDRHLVNGGEDDPAHTGSAGARWLKLSLGLVTTAVFVWLFARGLDFNALGRAFAELSVSAVLLALAVMATAHAVRIVRWWLLLRALEPSLPLSACIRPFLAGMAVNNVLPLRAGDAVRVMRFRRQLRSPAMRVLGTLVIERSIDTVVVSGIFFLGLLGWRNNVCTPSAW